MGHIVYNTIHNLNLIINRAMSFSDAPKMVAQGANRQIGIREEHVPSLLRLLMGLLSPSTNTGSVLQFVHCHFILLYILPTPFIPYSTIQPCVTRATNTIVINRKERNKFTGALLTFRRL